LGEVHLEVAASESRTVTGHEIEQRWRELTGPIPDAVEVSFTSSVFAAGEAINIQLVGMKVEELRAAANELKTHLAQYPGIYDISDSFREGKQEIKLAIKPEAEAVGLTLQDLARQVRQGFYGEEAQSIQRGRDEVKVMVRYPEHDRRSLATLENMMIRTPNGAEVPFSTVATVSHGRGYASIKRVDRQRAINVTAGVDEAKGNANEIAADLQSKLPQLLATHPGVRWTFEGERREQSDTMVGLASGFVVTLFVIYALLAIPFGSYTQPLIVMTAIPFGIIGAIWGHVLMGMNLTILSMFGVVALSGMVVNDSLVLVDFINQARKEGLSVSEAVRRAGALRFRAIILISGTTFLGLAPLILERSVQAQFLVPMAVSLGFGVIFSTAISLLLVPTLYLILEDLKSRLSGGKESADSPAAIPAILESGGETAAS
ncbi:MAG TPA: efflux RND transporter permease subunit, partial [Methylomirabilota bacterium]|nr:efflux RND transporter permease subunit [Methylomirabilota bacterium]